MAWFKVDDSFATSPKVLSIPRAHRMAVLGLWTVAGTWCAKHLTDGFVPAFMLEEWGTDLSHGTALVEAGLWTEVDGGYQFHDWSDYQPSKSDVHAQREKERQRKEAWRAKKAAKSGESPEDVPSGQTGGQDAGRTDMSALPDPARPDPTQVKEPLSDAGASDEGEYIPDDWKPAQKHLDLAASLQVDVHREAKRFREHAIRNKRRLKNWNTGFTNWLKQGVVMQRQRERASKKSMTLDEFRAHRDRMMSGG